MTHMGLKQFLVSSVFAASTLLAMPLTASAGGFEPMIELGGGTETSRGHGTYVLLRVTAGARKDFGSSEPGDILSPEQIVIARISGEVALTKDADGKTSAPYIDVEFVPVSNLVAVGNLNGNSMYGDIQILPTNIRRDIHLDQSSTLTIAVVGVKFEANRELNESFLLYIKAAVDLLGYRLVNRISDQDKFSGLHVGKIDAAIGLTVKIADSFHMRVAVGAEGDFNWDFGRRMEGTNSVYAELRASLLHDVIQIFIRASKDQEYDNQATNEENLRLTTGLAVIF